MVTCWMEIGAAARFGLGVGAGATAPRGSPTLSATPRGAISSPRPASDAEETRTARAAALRTPLPWSRLRPGNRVRLARRVVEVALADDGAGHVRVRRRGPVLGVVAEAPHPDRVVAPGERRVEDEARRRLG